MKSMLLFLCFLTFEMISCCRGNQKEYELISAAEINESHQGFYIKKLPATRTEKTWTCLKFIGTTTIIAAVSAGSALLAVNIINEENTINNDLNSITGGIDSGVHDVHEFLNITHIIEHFSKTCPHALYEFSEAIAQFVKDCDISI